MDEGENTMFAEQKKNQLIIVCTEKTRKYANYLIQLIGAKDDAEDQEVGIIDNSVEAVVWGEKDYKANLPTLKSSANILFIGSNKMIKDEAANMNEVFNSYGMQFKSLGHRAAMYVEDKVISKEDYEAFLDLCNKYQKAFEKVHLTFVDTANPVAKAIGLGISAINPISYTAAVAGLVKGVLNKGKVMDQQYTFLVLYSYLELLPKFLEDNE